MTRGAEEQPNPKQGPPRGSSGGSGEVGVPSSLTTSLGIVAEAPSGPWETHKQLEDRLRG